MNYELLVAGLGFLGTIVASVVAVFLQKKLNSTSKNTFKKQLLPQYSQSTDNKEINQDIDQIYNHLLLSFQSLNLTSVYLSKYEATIELYIEGDTIKVNSSYTLSFVNPYHVDYIYKRKPMLRGGLQYNSYVWENVTYQGRQCNEYIHKYPRWLQQAPNNKYMFKSGLEIPLSKNLSESVIHYSSKYTDHAGRFFNTYCFWHYCKMFSIDVRLYGPDSHNYEIQWEVFLSSNERNNRFGRNIHCNDRNHVSLCDHGWLVPSDGYVITINKIS